MKHYHLHIEHQDEIIGDFTCYGFKSLVSSINWLRFTPGLFFKLTVSKNGVDEFKFKTDSAGVLINTLKARGYK